MFCHHDVWGDSTLLAGLQIRCESLSGQHAKTAKKEKKKRKKKISAACNQRADFLKYADKTHCGRFCFCLRLACQDARPGMKSGFSFI